MVFKFDFNSDFFIWRNGIFSCKTATGFSNRVLLRIKKVLSLYYDRHNKNGPRKVISNNVVF